MFKNSWGYAMTKFKNNALGDHRKCRDDVELCMFGLTQNYAVSAFGFRVQGSGLRVWGLGLKVQGLGFPVWDLGFRVEGLGLGESQQ